jgi:hypothetical protein
VQRKLSGLLPMKPVSVRQLADLTAFNRKTEKTMFCGKMLFEIISKLKPQLHLKF